MVFYRPGRPTLCLWAVLITLAVAISSPGQAQTIIGMGTENPNPNAVLELVPENSNQGFLAPRLTSVQRTASSFIDKLTDTDNGLLVFDTDQGAFFYWYQGAWQRGISGDRGGADPDPVNHSTTWFTGAAAPSNIPASEGDFYINETSGDVYKFSNASFSIIGSLATSTDANRTQNLSSVLQQNNSAAQQKITDLGNPTDPGDAVTKEYVDAQVGAINVANDDNQTLTEVLAEGNDASGNNISNLADPSAPQDAATKKYVDDEIDGLVPLFGTDNQELTFNETTKILSIERGSNEVDLSSLDGGTPTLPNGQLFIGNSSSQATPVTISGDITIAADGTVTISNASISTDRLQNNAVTADKLANNAVVTSKIANDAVDRRKIDANVAGNGLSQAGNGSLQVNLGGDVVTTGNNLSVVKLRGNEIAPITPSNNQVLQWDDGNAQWTPADLPPGGGGGDQQWYEGTDDPNITNPSGSQNGDYYYRTAPVGGEKVYRKVAGSWEELGGFTNTSNLNVNGTGYSYRTPWLYTGSIKPDDQPINFGQLGDMYYDDNEEKMYFKVKNDEWKGL